MKLRRLPAPATMELIMTNANAAPAAGASLRSASAQPQEKPPTVSAQRMSDLLRRYPEVNDAEKLELIEFLKRGHPETLAMVTYGSGLVTEVGRVKRDHPEHFPSGWRTMLPWFGFFMVVLLLIMVARLI
jgi:hypothetical protein